MALRLDPVRLLIADDVGVGKTIETCMIARELLDRGIVKRFIVLCPSHLCDQWEAELREKFAIHAEVVQSSTFARLERGLPSHNFSVYSYYPHLVVSIDLAKIEKHRNQINSSNPELVIVDEAHGASRPRGAKDNKGEQFRFDLLKELSEDKKRHIILVTATPHNGIEDCFRSLLGVLDRDFDVPSESSELDRRKLQPHIVQRRRIDVESAEAPFPERIPTEVSYPLSDGYSALFKEVLEYCTETVSQETGMRAAQKRVRLWAALAILRCVLSSPDAAVAVLSGRRGRIAEAKEGGGETDKEIDDAYAPQVLDSLSDAGVGDFSPTAPFEDPEAGWTDSELRRLAKFEKLAADIANPKQDRKLEETLKEVRKLLKAKHRPIVFCRFIPSAKYVAKWIEKELGSEFKNIRVKAVTGELGDDERKEAIRELCGRIAEGETTKESEHPRVLVATDCLSEGINLQADFDAIIHYDLPWNPNRMEQREGRVDRFGQVAKTVRTVIVYGTHVVDSVVRQVLIDKATTIRKRLGVALPVPSDNEEVVRVVLAEILFRGKADSRQMELAINDPRVSAFHKKMEDAALKEKDQRAYFAQHAIKPDEVSREISAVDSILGSPDDVHHFLAGVLQRHKGKLAETKKAGVYELDPGDMEKDLTLFLGKEFPVRVTFDRLKDPDAIYLGRTHPAVHAVCLKVFDEAFSTDERAKKSLFVRSGAMFTKSVDVRTGLALLRIRYRITENGQDEFAEEIVLAAFHKKGDGPEWIEPFDSARELARKAKPAANMDDDERKKHVRWALDLLKAKGAAKPVIEARSKQIMETHTRIRGMMTMKGDPRPKLGLESYEPDILGCFVLVPGGRD